MMHGHPAPDFPLYGVDASEPQPRWLSSVDGRLGHPAIAVWLECGAADPRSARDPWLKVATMRRDRLHREVHPGLESTPADLASDAMFALADLTLPHPDGRSDEDESRRWMDLAEREAGGHEQWPRVTWTIDGTATSVPVVRRAGAWAGFSRAVPTVDLVVLGFGVEPDGLTLSEVRDTSAYHFDGDRPIEVPATVERSRSRALTAAGVDTRRADDSWWPAHPDHHSPS